MIKIERADIKNTFRLGIDFLDEDYSDIFKKVSLAYSMTVEKDFEPLLLKATVRDIKELTEKHFESEEGYMRFEGSRSFMFHKHCHELMKEKLFPALDEEIEAPLPSLENIKKVLGIFLGMFSAHILFEDVKLKDKTPSGLKYKDAKDHQNLESSVAEALRELSEINAVCEEGEIDLLNMDDSLAYERTYNLNDCSTVRLKAIFEEELISGFFADAFKMKIDLPDTTALYALLEFTREAALKLSSLFKIGSVYSCEGERLISSDDIEMSLMQKKPSYSLSFKIGDNNFAVFADKL